MRLEVAARKSSFLWWRTDDGRYPCVFGMGERPAKVLKSAYYGLGVFTEENSAITRPS